MTMTTTIMITITVFFRFCNMEYQPTLGDPLSSLPSFPPLSLSSPFVRSRALKFSYGVWGSVVSSPSGVRGAAPAEIEFGVFLPQK